MKNISDQILLERTKHLVKTEKEITAKIVKHLDEIDRRKLFCDLKYSSLYDYCINELSYSEDQAYRRITAMRLARDNVTVKSELNKGQLSLTNINLLKSTFDNLELSNCEKSSLVKKVSGQSKSKCQEEIFKLYDEKGVEPPKKKEKVIPVSLEEASLSVNLKKKTIERLKKHQLKKNVELDELLNILLDEIELKEEYEAKPKKKGKDVGKGRYIPKNVKAQVLKRADHKCENCNNEHFLEFEHIVPFSRGGKSELSNLKILCRNCNQRAWKKFSALERKGMRGPPKGFFL
ncbi:MAG: HNH endonuclease [Oligoflexia bacterium]|nr:HNH endonuclease [Oligoflexia bacterium]